MKQPAVYILASGPRGTLYIGIAGWLRHRIWEHPRRTDRRFHEEISREHLAWFELFADFPSAIARETQLKKWNRAWKVELIEKANPSWIDRWPELLE